MRGTPSAGLPGAMLTSLIPANRPSADGMASPSPPPMGNDTRGASDSGSRPSSRALRSAAIAAGKPSRSGSIMGSTLSTMSHTTGLGNREAGHGDPGHRAVAYGGKLPSVGRGGGGGRDRLR